MIAVETLTKELIDELMPIIIENHNETGHFKELALDWDMYLSLGDSFMATILRIEGKIVGYIFYMIGRYPHNYHWIMAQQISVFVKPECRKWSGPLMHYAEKELANYNVRLIIQSARVNTPFCKVLERSGYTPTDVTYCKELY